MLEDAYPLITLFPLGKCVHIAIQCLTFKRESSYGPVTGLFNDLINEL